MDIEMETVDFRCFQLHLNWRCGSEMYAPEVQSS